jgi:hypothetical protein
MIGLKVAGGWLDLAAGTISMDINSPLFSADSVPGTTTYPFGLPVSPGNMQKLNFPHVRADQGERIAPEPTQFYIDGVMRWVGALVYLDLDEEKGLFAYNFVADAADLQSRIEGVTLASLDLGRVPLSLVHDAADYALPCLRNVAFYGDEAADYCQVVNYYRAGAYQLSPGGKRTTIVPLLRLVPLLRRVLGVFGYTVTGSWLDHVDVQALILYSDRSVEDAAGSLPVDFAVNRHVPDVAVADLLIDLQKLFGLAYTFHPVRREMHIRALRDIIVDPQYRVRTTTGSARTTAVTSNGFTLKMELADDELNKKLDTSWTQLRVGAGKQVISTSAGTLHVLREPDVVAPDREWLIPVIEAKGASLAFELGDDSRCGLSLLFDRGLQEDSEGDLYPLATWGRESFDAFGLIGLSTLHWDGADGLYETWHRAWLEFLDRAATKERTVRLRVADLLTLDPARKDMVDHRRYLWEKVSLKLSTTGQMLESAEFTYRYTRL